MRPIKNLTILGGGSAGWMTAKYLSVKNPELNITIIESPNIPNIGVGETTTPYLMKFLESIGITDESEWMPRCNATLKNGVLYQDWDFIGSRFFHAFEVDDGNYPYWNMQRVEKGLDRQDYWTSTMQVGASAMRDSSKWLSDKDGNIPPFVSQDANGWPQNWAYHIDAQLFVDYLKEISKEVNHILVDIVEMPSDENGITKLIADDGREFTADMYVDCTGFRKSLIGKVNDDFSPLTPYLTHDKAIAMPYPYLDKETEMKPRSKATALSAGWAWEVPLYNRIGSGYCYTSKYITDEEAEKELRDLIGFDRVKDCESFKIDMQTGYYKQPMTKNVLAIGLSAGFIEPLEGTVLFAIQVAGIRLDNYIKGEITKEEYNKEMTMIMNNFLDFISLNYHLSHREDSQFWIDQKNIYITDKMLGWVAGQKDKLQPPPVRELFVNSSWISKAISYNQFPDSVEFEDYNKEDKLKADKFMEEMRKVDHTSRISQKEYLDKFIYKV